MTALEIVISSAAAYVVARNALSLIRWLKRRAALRRAAAASRDTAASYRAWRKALDEEAPR